MIGALIGLISLDVCAKLIGAGMVYSTATVAGASNTTPIVITTAEPHGFLPAQKYHGLVSGVGGNTNANGIWEMTVIDDTNVSLGLFTPQGAPTQAIGNGTYTGGGVVQTALPDGRIRLGRKYRKINGRPNRITFVPYGMCTWQFDPYGGSIPPTAIPRTLASQTAEQKTMKLQRQIVTEKQRFQIYSWGAASPPDPDFGDYDATQILYQQVVQSLWTLATQWEIRGGEWISQAENYDQWNMLGQEHMLQLEISQPTLDQMLAFVPTGTTATLTVELDGATPDDQLIITGV